MCLEDFIIGRSMRYTKTVFTAPAINSAFDFVVDKSRVAFILSNPSAGTASIYWRGSATTNPQVVVGVSSTYEARFDIRDYGQLVTDGFTVLLTDAAATIEVVELFLPTSAADVNSFLKDYRR